MSLVITMANLANQPYFSAYACTLGRGGGGGGNVLAPTEEYSQLARLNYVAVVIG